MTVVAVIDARPSLAAAARRTSELVESLDLDRPVSGSEWTVGDTVAHLTSVLRGFTSSALGNFAEWYQWQDKIPSVGTRERIEALNRALVAAEPRGDAQATARGIVEHVDGFLAATASLPLDKAIPTPWYGEHETLTVAEATCLLLGEQLIHGFDMARAFGRKWPISKHDALLTFEAGRQMMPRIADRAAIGRMSATYELRLGRSARFVIRISDGAAVIEPVAGQRIDCHVLGEPVAMLLLAYGRISQWQAIGRGRLITWGKKPWIAFRLTSFFSNP